MIRTTLVVLSLLTVAACGNRPGVQVELEAVSGVFNALRAAALDPSATAQPPSVVTTGTPEQVREVIATLPGALKSLIVLRNGESAILFDAGTNGPYHRWATPTGQTLTFRGGVLSGTRGFGFDLMSADVNQSAALIRGRKLGNADKVLRYLNGEDDEVPFALKCTVSSRGPETVTLATGESRHTTKMRETCISGRFTVNNFYWVDGRGQVVQSRQWGGREIGEIIIQSLRD